MVDCDLCGARMHWTGTTNNNKLYWCSDCRNYSEVPIQKAIWHYEDKEDD